MGRVAGAYGVRGWLKVAPDAGCEAGLVRAAQWWIGEQMHEVVSARIHGGTVVGKLQGMDSREQAEALKGRPVGVRRDALPDPGEGRYYLADLLGLAVVNTRGVMLGAVRRTHSNGVHDVIEVAGERVRLIPWVPAVVSGVDLQAKQVLVEWEADW